MSKLKHKVNNLLYAVLLLCEEMAEKLTNDDERARFLRLQGHAREVADMLRAIEEQSVKTATSLGVVLVEDDVDIRSGLKTMLLSLGHSVLGEASSGPEMVRLVEKIKPDVILFDIHLPGFSGLEAYQQISKKMAIPGVAVTGDQDVCLLDQAMQDGILGYLVKPVDVGQLRASLALAWVRYDEFKQLRKEVSELSETLTARKIVERAKGVLMRRNAWSESAAFRCIQKNAMNRRLKLVEVAQEVLNGQKIEEFESVL